MGTAVFDTLRFARGLREAGVPEQQADRQAELMAEAFSAFADKLVTKDYFSEVLSARLKEQTAFLEQRMTERFAEQDARIAAQFAAMDEKFTKQFAAMDEKFTKQFAAMDEKFTKQLAAQDDKFTKRSDAQDDKFTKRSDAQDDKFTKRIDAQDAKFISLLAEMQERTEARFAEHDSRFARIDRTLALHSWMLGLILLVLVVPQLKALFA
ncbi:MAG TPA: hypothetical protein DD491_05475 [Halieaceae bacterium]|nr:hypothetical protein [Halieaceae bacterium]